MFIRCFFFVFFVTTMVHFGTEVEQKKSVKNRFIHVTQTKLGKDSSTTFMKRLI